MASWEVTVWVDCEEVLTLSSSGAISGDPFVDEKREEIIAAAEHLLSFIGAPKPKK